MSELLSLDFKIVQMTLILAYVFESHLLKWIRSSLFGIHIYCHNSLQLLARISITYYSERAWGFQFLSIFKLLISLWIFLHFALSSKVTTTLIQMGEASTGRVSAGSYPYYQTQITIQLIHPFGVGLKEDKRRSRVVQKGRLNAHKAGNNPLGQK